MATGHHVFIEAKRYAQLPFTNDEIAMLIRARVVEWVGGRYVFRMVGAAAIGRTAVYVLPKFESEANLNAVSGLYYVKALKRYLASGSKRSSISPVLENAPLIMTTFDALNAFFSRNGLFREKQDVLVSNDSKKINWSKTVHKNEAMFSTFTDLKVPLASVLYSRPLVSAMYNHEGEIARLFLTVLSLLATYLSPIMRIKHPLELGASITSVLDDLNGIIKRSSYYKRLLRTHISREAGSRKRVLQELFKFLNVDNESLATSLREKVFVFGTHDFEYVWEDACLNAVSATRDPKFLAQPMMTTFSDIEVAISSQRADGIIVAADPSLPKVVVDAKYYVPNERRKVSFSAADFMKQFGYGLSARASFDRDEIRNVLLLPGVDLASTEAAVHLGFARLTLDQRHVDEVDDIDVFQVCPTMVFDAYIKRRPSKEVTLSLFQALMDSNEGGQQTFACFDDEGHFLLSNCVVQEDVVSFDFNGEEYPEDRLLQGLGKTTITVGDTEFSVTSKNGLEFSNENTDVRLFMGFSDEADSGVTEKRRVIFGTEISLGSIDNDLHLVFPVWDFKCVGFIRWAHLRHHQKKLKKQLKNDVLHYKLIVERTEEGLSVFARSMDRVPLMKLPFHSTNGSGWV